MVDDLGDYDLEPVDYDPHDIEATPVQGNPFAGELKPYNPSWSERLGAATQDLLTRWGAPLGYAQDFGQKAREVAGFVPGLGNALSANDAYRNAQSGNYFGAALSALGALPVPGSAIEGAIDREFLRIANPIIAYHGSPYKFDQFDASKIGTGEGAQAYGHGMYLAQNEGTARTYRDALSPPAIKIGNQTVVPERGSPEDMALAHLTSAQIQEPGNPYGKARQAMRSQAQYEPHNADLINKARGVLDQWQDAGAIPTSGGHMYQVAIHADPDQFLDWDKPLSKQHPKIRQFIEHHADARRLTGNSFTKGQLSEPTGQDIFNRMSGLRTPEMQSAGIPGIRYLDQGSRSAGQGSHNYVVFDPRIIEIMRRYGLAGLGGSVGAGALIDQYSQPALSSQQSYY